jgi:Glycosyl hydrolase catalytic core
MSSKKGFVYSPKSNPNFNSQLESLNLGWYYTWGLTGYPNLELKFTPMVWGLPSVSKLDQIPAGSTEILAFNEPDGAQQSNISVQEVVSVWHQLKAKAVSIGARLGSVATAQNPLAPNSYFDQLWNALPPTERPDFICLHWYAPPNADSFLQWLDNIWGQYKKPIWVTEMCVADWKATADAPEKFTTDQIQHFMDAVVAGMNARPYVERFCWKTRPTTDVNMGNGALIALDGTLTPLGEHYASLS